MAGDKSFVGLLTQGLTRIDNSDWRRNFYYSILIIFILWFSVLLFDYLIRYKILTERNIARKTAVVQLTAELVSQRLDAIEKAWIVLVDNMKLSEKISAGNWQGAVQDPGHIFGALENIEHVFVTDSQAVIMGGFPLESDEALFIADQQRRVVFHPRLSSRGDILDFSSVLVVQKILAGQKGVEFAYNPTERTKNSSVYQRCS